MSKLINIKSLVLIAGVLIFVVVGYFIVFGSEVSAVSESVVTSGSEMISDVPSNVLLRMAIPLILLIVTLPVTHKAMIPGEDDKTLWWIATFTLMFATFISFIAVTGWILKNDLGSDILLKFCTLTLIGAIVFTIFCVVKREHIFVTLLPLMLLWVITLLFFQQHSDYAKSVRDIRIMETIGPSSQTITIDSRIVDK